MPEMVISYNFSVRRLLALSLLLIFSLPLASPLLALSANSDANLPICCRRNGAHHCQMKMQRTNASAGRDVISSIPVKCPFYPRAATLVRHNDARIHSNSGILVELVHHATIKFPTYTFGRIALDTAWQKRGPPSYAA